MKELTTEQKAKAYDETIKKAKQLLYIARCNKDEDRVWSLIDMFPELEESEDEKIRKELLKIVEESEDSLYMVMTPNKRERLIAWLEKQGEQKSINNQFTPEQANILDKHIDKILEQKPSYKVEPKFHEGDWISGYYTNYKVMAINSKGYAVEDTEGNKINILFENEKFHHLFTITDAKDGDVLATDDWVFIFKKFNANGPTCYCHYDVELGFVIDVNTYISTGSYIRPAAKEQRDTLMKAMNKAGYTFDFKKKELKKVEPKSDFELSLKHIMEEAIECGDTHNLGADAELLYNIAQKSAEWSEEDEERYLSCLKRLSTGDIKQPETINTVWLKSLKDRVHPQPKQEWNEEDEHMLKAIFDSLNTYAKMAHPCLKSVVEEEINWLKSLKPQKQWKPSEKQIDAIHYVVQHYNPNACERLAWDSLKTLEIMYNDLKNLTE